MVLSRAWLPNGRGCLWGRNDAHTLYFTHRWTRERLRSLCRIVRESTAAEKCEDTNCPSPGCLHSPTSVLLPHHTRLRSIRSVEFFLNIEEKTPRWLQMLPFKDANTPTRVAPRWCWRCLRGVGVRLPMNVYLAVVPRPSRRRQAQEGGLKTSCLGGTQLH